MRSNSTKINVHPPGDGKVCGGCGLFFPYEQFSWNAHANGRRYRCSRCKACKAAATRAWAKRLFGNRASHAIGLRKGYGLSLAEYDSMLASQHGVCAICGGKEKATTRGKLRPLAVDHCHKTGKVRGLLCSTCNNGLGCFKDDANNLHAAISYLKRHR